MAFNRSFPKRHAGNWPLAVFGLVALWVTGAPVHALLPLPPQSQSITLLRSANN